MRLRSIGYAKSKLSQQIVDNMKHGVISPISGSTIVSFIWRLEQMFRNFKKVIAVHSYTHPIIKVIFSAISNGRRRVLSWFNC